MTLSAFLDCPLPEGINDARREAAEELGRALKAAAPGLVVPEWAIARVIAYAEIATTTPVEGVVVTEGSIEMKFKR